MVLTHSINTIAANARVIAKIIDMKNLPSGGDAHKKADRPYVFLIEAISRYQRFGFFQRGASSL